MNQPTVVASSIKLQTAAEPDVRPLPLWQSAVAFGASAGLGLMATYLVIPLLVRNGVAPLQSMLAAFIIPFAFFLAASLAGYAAFENRPPLRQAFADRMWFRRISRRDLAWAAGLFVASTLVTGLMTLVERGIVASGLIPIPPELPLLIDPRVSLSSGLLEQAAGGSLVGKWGLVLLFTLYLFFNIAGEELWFRGYLLPRQVAQHGRFAWLLHGLMWTSFHAFKWWALLTVLPVALMMAYVSQRTGSNWPALINHLVGNSLFFFMILAGAFGL